MRGITKNREPRSLAIHRRTQYSDYNNYEDKETLRQALVAEQRGLCCYCMSRIRCNPDSMKIEHWRCQSRYTAQQLNYRNLLGACTGGEGLPPHLQTCDTRKADRDLKWNPAEPSHYIRTCIRYEPDGSIRSDDTEFDTQLEDVLNLNLIFLKNNRKGVLDAVLEWWKKERARRRGPVPRARFEAERDKRIGGTGDLVPYCQVAAWWIEQRLTRMSA